MSMQYGEEEKGVKIIYLDQKRSFLIKTLKYWLNNLKKRLKRLS